jgi:hypothetical protein
MIPRVDEHPADELLMEQALHGAHPEVEAHCVACHTCSRYVDEVRELREALEVLPEEDVPTGLRQKVLGGTGGLGSRWYMFDVRHLLQSPFAVGLALVLFVLFLYAYFIYLL